AKADQTSEEARQRPQREADKLLAKGKLEAEGVRTNILSSKVRANRLRILDEKNRIVQEVLGGVEEKLSNITKSSRFGETAQRFVAEAVKAVDSDQPVVRLGFKG